jgi:hypothetical protein
MKQNNHSQQPDSKSAGIPEAAAALKESNVDFAPAPDEVAWRAYFSYERPTPLQGEPIQHWLAEEEILMAEHKISLGSRSS